MLIKRDTTPDKVNRLKKVLERSDNVQYCGYLETKGNPLNLIPYETSKVGNYLVSTDTYTTRIKNIDDK